MNDQKANIAVAEFHYPEYSAISGFLCSITPDRNGEPVIEQMGYIPDYGSDLNAVHEAVLHAYKTQPIGWLGSFEDALTEVCSRAQLPTWNPICAEAYQVREALLRTIGKWEEEKA